MIRYLDKISGINAWKIALGFFLLVGWLDYSTGYQVSLVGFYFLNVAFLGWCAGRKAALIAAFLGTLIWWSMDRVSGFEYSWALFGYWNAFMRLILFAVGGVACAELRRALKEKQVMIDELRGTLDQVKTLSGILPVCPCCQKVRVEKGEWEKLDVYVREKSQIEFVSSICPSCVESEMQKS